MAPIMMTILISLLSTILLLSITILGLAASSLVHRPDGRWYHTVDIYYFPFDTEAWEALPRTTAKLSYLPDNFTLSDQQALLGVAIAGIVFGSIIILCIFFQRTKILNVALTGRKVRSLRFTSPAIILVQLCILVALSVAITAYTWNLHRVSAATGWIDTDQFPLRPRFPPAERYWTYHSPALQTWTTETWNQALQYYMLPNAANPSAATLESRRKQAMAARVLILPLAALAGVALVLYFWIWRRQNVAARRAEEGGSYGGTAVKRSPSELSQWQRSSHSDEATWTAREMESSSADKAELSSDASVKEMLAGSTQWELDGANHRTEMSVEREKA